MPFGLMTPKAVHVHEMRYRAESGHQSEVAMENMLIVATVWLGLAVIAAIIAYHIHVSIALVEICLGVIAAAVAAQMGLSEYFGSSKEWLKFLASSGAILLTFLAGAELDPKVMRSKKLEVTIIGIVGFLAPFLGCTAVAYYLLAWNLNASLLCGVALSTTSMAVVYAVMLETGFNRTEFGKGILGACFVNDLGTVLALGIIFSPFTYKTVIFIVASTLVIGLLPFITKGITSLYAHKTAAIRTKWIVFVLFGLGALAIWSGSEAVLPAYLAGMVLAGGAARDANWIRRFRTLTVGFLTPFYFLRAGTFVSISALVSTPIVLLILFSGKIVSKIFGLFPIVGLFRRDLKEKWYYTLMMSTGLTFGTISALFGFSHGIVSNDQYSLIVIVVIGSAVIPTIIAGTFSVPNHLLNKERVTKISTREASSLQNE